MPDVYAIITERIVNLLENGTVPWNKPWQGGELMPRNLVSKKEYRGINTFLLHAMSYQSPHWVTFKQAAELGGTVRKGEKSCPVVFWKWLETVADDGAKKRIPLLRYYSVFNVAQCDGLPEIPGSAPVTREFTPIQEAERIVAGMPKRPEIKHGLSKAFYSPSGDYVGMPSPENFKSDEDYYSVLFHELIHSTGHESRVNRKGITDVASFGSETYSKEELVAEMGAAFLSGKVGIVERTIDNSAAYIKSRLSRIKEDSKLIVHAAAQAQKASDFILNVTFGEQAA